MFYRPRDNPANLLNMTGGFRAGIGQLVNLLRHNRKSGPRRARPGGLNRGVDSDEVGGGGYVKDILGQDTNLIHAMAFFNGLIQHRHDVRCFFLDCLCLHAGGAFHLLGAFTHPG